MGCNAYLICPIYQIGFFYFSAKMNNKLCRICGCEVRELDLCTTCRLSITSICNCCKNVVDTQTHASGMCDACHGL